MVDLYVDAADGMASLGEVAVWAFDLALWGECAQAPDDGAALAKFAKRVGRDDLTVVERIVGPNQVFERDYQAANDEEVDVTLQLLRQHRATTLELLHTAGPDLLDAQDASVVQPAWMPWRTPRSIAWHIASDGYLKRLGLPMRPPGLDLFEELHQSAAHVEAVVTGMRRDLVAEYKGEVWTSVKLLRRLAWHERVEQVFLRRRLRAAGIPV